MKTVMKETKQKNEEVSSAADTDFYKNLRCILNDRSGRF